MGAQSDIERLIELGLNRYGAGDLEGAVLFWEEALAIDPEKANQMTLVYTAGLPGAFTSKKTLGKLDDIKGQKWRAGGKWGLKFLKNAGATPVSVPWGDVYMALQTGTIDGCFTNYDGLHMMKFDEVAPNLLVSRTLVRHAVRPQCEFDLLERAA